MVGAHGRPLRAARRRAARRRQPRRPMPDARSRSPRERRQRCTACPRRPPTCWSRGAHVLDPRTDLDAPSTCSCAAARSPSSARREGWRRPRASRSSTAGGAHLLPAFVDPHVHLRRPARSTRRTSRPGPALPPPAGSAPIIAMPNTSPPIDSASVLRSVADAGQRPRPRSRRLPRRRSRAASRASS